MANRMRKIRSPQTATAEQTARSVQLVESNASEAFDGVDKEMSHIFRPVTVDGGASLNPQIWDFVLASDSSYVYLPEPTPEMTGCQVAVCSQDSSSIPVYPLAGSLRGGSSVTISSPIPVYFICDGKGWW